jgi:hypothetical protein
MTHDEFVKFREWQENMIREVFKMGTAISVPHIDVRSGAIIALRSVEAVSEQPCPLGVADPTAD